jgi:hypothetical protein
MSDVFGALADDPSYAASFSDALSRIWSQGTRAALASYIEG